MIQRFFMVAAVVFTLLCHPPSLSAQDDTGPFAQASKRQGGLHDLLTPADKAKRAPLPPRAEREKAMAQVREVFGHPDDPKRRAALVKGLIKAGREDEEPVNRYAALRRAGELAVEGADLAAASEAADVFSEIFDVDALAIKASPFERLFGKVADRELLRVAASHFDEALAADHFEAATRIGRVAYKAAVAARDKQQIAAMRRSAARVKKRKAAFDALKSAIATLKEKPDDVPANLQIGEYLCFHRGAWERGLPLLVKGGHAIAKQEAGAEDPAAQKKVGDAWWDLAETKKGRTETHIKARAATWYQRALPKLVGLSKRRVQKRLDSVASDIEANPRWQAKLVNLALNAAYTSSAQEKGNGSVKRAFDGNLSTGGGGYWFSGKEQIPAWLRVEFPRPSRVHTIRLLIPHGTEIWKNGHGPVDYDILVKRRGKEERAFQVRDGRGAATVVANEKGKGTKFVTFKFAKPFVTSSVRLLVTRTSGSNWGALVFEMEVFGNQPRSAKRPAHPADAVAFGGHWYKLVVGRITWDEAKRRCETMGGYLACLESEPEAKAIANLIVRTGKTSKWVCLGGFKDPKDKWQWINGHRMRFSFFSAGEPNNFNGGENRLAANGRGQWNDIKGESKRIQAFVCEWDR